MCKPLFNNCLWFALCLLLGTLPSCSINVKKDENGEEKKVDIETPVGEIHVNKQPDVREIGVPVYPGAHLVNKPDQGREKSAGVNISNSLFGLKVVAQEYESDAPPERLLAFYAHELKKYGKVLECKTSWHSATDVTVDDDDSKQSHELSCRQETGDTTELKVGSKQNQHIVAIEPRGKGSKFALVLVQIRGRQGMI